MEQVFPMVAKTFRGLEDVLRDELISLGAHNVEMGNRMVSFEGDLAMMYRANLCCRTALRILKPIEKFTADGPDELYDIVRDIDWEKYMTVDSTFAVDVTVNSADFTNSRFVTYRVKDGIVDHFRDKYDRRPSIRVSGADLIFNVHIDGDRVTISLDSSGEPLSKRGYRVEQTQAPINEVLAAGIIMKTGWRGDSNFADPMCGSGTFLIEAALIACNINPGIYRQDFAFEKWPDFDRDLFEDLYNDDSAEKEFDFKIYGGDIDPEAVAIARRNMQEAHVDNLIELTCRPFSDWTDNPEPGILVTNPPYGERLKPEDMGELYREIGRNLKRNFPGWNAWILGLNEDDFANIGLKPTIKIPILNGSLECSLREYVLFDGRYDDFRADGGSVGRGEYQEDSKPRKMRRLSDDEWKSETRKFGHDHKERKAYSKKDSGKAFKNNKFIDFDDDDRKPARRFDDDRKPARKFDDDRKPARKFDDDRKPALRFDDDRKPARRFDDDRKPTRRFDDDRKPARKFDDDRKPARRFNDDRKPARKFDDRNKFDSDRRGGFGKEKGSKRDFSRPVEITDRGPQLPKSSETRINDVYMRSRKKKPN